MFKKVLSLGLGLTLSASVFAVDGSIDKLNNQATTVLADYQNATTATELKFNEFELGTEHAQKIAISGFFNKIGSHNEFHLTLDNLSYDYGDGLAPTLKIKGSLGFDLSKNFSQELLNYWAPSTDKILENYARTFIGETGVIKSVITSMSKDSAENVTQVTTLLRARIDLDNLPDHTTSKEVISTEVVLSLSVDVKKGLELNAYVAINPEFRLFENDQRGLKEYLELLLENDDLAIFQINYIAKEINDFALLIVEPKPGPRCIVESINSKTK